jgi:hypothetical protein
MAGSFIIRQSKTIHCGVGIGRISKAKGAMRVNDPDCSPFTIHG